MKEKKKICFFSGDITRSGGTERVATRIANELVKQGKYEVFFVSLAEQSEEVFFDIDRSIKHYALGKKWISPGPLYVSVIFKLRKFLREHKPDIIVDIDIALDILSIPACVGLDVKIVSWEHSNYDFENTISYRRWILGFSIKRSDFVVTLTEEDRINYGKKGGRKTNIKAIGNPIDITGGKLTYEDGKRENSIVTTTRLIKSKGTKYLLRVAESVLKKHTDWKWYVLGDGEDREMMESFLQSHNLKGRLILEGRVRNVNEYLKKSKIFVFTSMREGLPMSLLEAKSCNLPCVSFDIQTGPSEVIKNGINGYLIEPFDTDKMSELLSELMENSSLREEFASHVMDDMGKYNLDNVITQWNEVLDGLCSKKKEK